MYKLVVILWVVSLLVYSAQASCPILEFQSTTAVSFTRESTTDYIQVTRTVPNMTAFTLCAWMKPAGICPGDNRTMYMISYAVPGRDDEILLGDPKSLKLFIGTGTNNEGVMADGWDSGVSVYDGMWHHICVTWLSTVGLTVLYKDGVARAIGTMKKGHVIQGGGSLIIGQEQDTMGGGFQSHQSYIGNVYGITMWNRKMNPHEIFNMSKGCHTHLCGNVLQWNNIRYGTWHGQVQVIDPRCEPIRQTDVSFTRESITDYIVVTKRIHTLTSFTLCLWMKTITPLFSGIISYAVPGRYNEILLANPKSLTLFIGTSSPGWNSNIDVHDGMWHHICVTWNNLFGKTLLYKDGVQKGYGILEKGHVIKEGGSLIIGQDQATMAGGCESRNSYIGKLSRINMWASSNALHSTEIFRMSKTCEISKYRYGDAVMWSDVISGIKHGQVQLVKPSSCKPRKGI